MRRDTGEADSVIARHPQLRSVDNVEFLNKGFSKDRKYILYERGEPIYLLRISDIENLVPRKQDFDLLQMHFQRGVRCSPPFGFGVDDRNLLCYTLLGYIAGESGATALPKLRNEHQHKVGLDAGSELWALHQLTHASDKFDWYQARVAKYQRKVTLARRRKLTFRKQAAVERFIDSTIALLRESEIRFQHDDYHLDNLIVHDGTLQGVIDFNRCDWGDPVEDFYKVPWFTTSISIPFSRGQVEG